MPGTQADKPYDAFLREQVAGDFLAGGGAAGRDFRLTDVRGRVVREVLG